MNKKGQEEFVGIMIFLVLIVFIFLFWAFTSVTVNVVSFEVSNGKISSPILIERVVSRINTWGDDYNKGFYDVDIYFDEELIEKSRSSGAGLHVYSIYKFVECVDIYLFNEDGGKQLDVKKEVCKND